MVAPDVQIEDGKGTILISSEEGETEGKEEVYAIVRLCFVWREWLQNVLWLYQAFLVRTSH